MPDATIGGPEFPLSLDHLVLGCADLDQGIELVAARAGLRAAAGGPHPRRGTRNALLSLGGRRYLEIMAPDPAQRALNWFHSLPDLREPRLVGWAATGNRLEELAERIRAGGIACSSPQAGSRVRPDGVTLRWSTLHLADDLGGLLPFFIDWGESAAHPAQTAPDGLRLARLSASAPDVPALQRSYALLHVEIAVAPGPPGLRAVLVGPSGSLVL